MQENYSIEIEDKVQNLGDKYLVAYNLAERIAATAPHNRDELLKKLRTKSEEIHSIVLEITQ